MAKSFAEAFQIAQAAKAATVSTDVPDHASSAAHAAQQIVPDQDQWSHQVANVTPLAHKNDADLTIESVIRPPARRNAAVETQTIAVDGETPTTPAVKRLGKSKKRSYPNLEEYYERLAQIKRAQARPASAPPRYSHLQPAPSIPAPKQTAPCDCVTLTVAPDAKVVWDGTTLLRASLLKNDSSLGSRTQVSSAPASAREIVLGLDFGTSSAKVVIGDRGLQTAHAVPFRDAIGIDAYLLPARLYETNGIYSLHSGTRHFNDLKLALLANPDDVVLKCRAVGYLALTIREARAWLFTTHAESYSKTEIVWTLALGLPAEHAGEDSLRNVFAQLGTAAWTVAGQEVVSPDVCRRALADVATGARDEDVEVIIMPEIAAQIYGFADSSRFDAKARNFFLIADVGAGTVDTCLFRVIPAKGGRWSFEIYAAAVEPAGVMNLHRHRIAWWQRHLSSNSIGARLCRELEDIKLGTENEIVIPTRYNDYLSGVSVQFAGKATDPDKEFFQIPLLRQVRGRTLYQTFTKGLLSKQDIVDVPFFLCGGGARLRFYHELGEALRRFFGCSWLSAKNEELAIPNNLRAEGVSRRDYDRLSVAYGLSMLNLANITTEEQLPKLAPHLPTGEWREHYVDKDQC